jgi:hypothetical protein
MKKEPKLVTEKVVEIYGFTHKEILVSVKIDYKRNEISLLEGYKGSSYNFNGEAKKYVFANRGVQYMQGWLNILEAMQEAVKDAKRRYEAELAERSAFKKEDNLVGLVKILQKTPMPKKGENEDSKGRFVIDGRGRKIYL